MSSSSPTIPEGWRRIRLSEACEPDAPIMYGILQPGPEVADGVPYVRPTEIDDNRIRLEDIKRTTPAIAERYRRAQLRTGDLLITIVGTLGKIAVVPPELDGANITQSSARIRIARNVADTRYIRHVLRSYVAIRQYDAMRLGTGVPRLNIHHVRDLEIPLPPLAQQKRIAAVLDKADDLRGKRRQALATLDTLLQSVFFDMFGDPVTSPKGWPVKPLASICPISGEYGSGAAATAHQPGLPRYVRITDIDENGRLRGSAAAPDCPEADWRHYLLSDGDLLFARSGATVGKTFLYSALDGFAVFAGYLIRFRPDPKTVLPVFLYHFTRTSWYAGWVQGKQRVVAQPNINATQYGELPVPIPPIDLQRRFAERIALIGRQREAMSRNAAAADALFATLQSAAFAGTLFKGERATPVASPSGRSAVGTAAV